MPAVAESLPGRSSHPRNLENRPAIKARVPSCALVERERSVNAPELMDVLEESSRLGTRVERLGICPYQTVPYGEVSRQTPYVWSEDVLGRTQERAGIELRIRIDRRLSENVLAEWWWSCVRRWHGRRGRGLAHRTGRRNTSRPHLIEEPINVRARDLDDRCRCGRWGWSGRESRGRDRCAGLKCRGRCRRRRPCIRRR